MRRRDSLSPRFLQFASSNVPPTIFFTYWASVTTLPYLLPLSYEEDEDEDTPQRRKKGGKRATFHFETSEGDGWEPPHSESEDPFDLIWAPLFRLLPKDPSPPSPLGILLVRARKRNSHGSPRGKGRRTAAAAATRPVTEISGKKKGAATMGSFAPASLKGYDEIPSTDV